MHGKQRPAHPDRVAWTFAHNLPTDDPELAAELMTATAQLSPRTKKAAYHLMIAWHPNELPTPEIMQEIARRTLELAELGEHQALVMGHGDKPHAHLHMLINRVHPTTGKAWKTSHDFARFDRIMKLLAEEYGFQHVPTHLYNPEQTDELPAGPKKRSTHAAKRGSDTARPYLANADARELGSRLSERLDRASSWDDIELAFAEEGFALTAKPQGLSAVGSHAQVKFSRLGLQTSAKGFERRFEQSFTSWQQARHDDVTRRLLAVDGVDITTALRTIGLADRDDVQEAVRQQQACRRAWQANKSLSDKLHDELRQSLAASTSLKPPRPPQRLARQRRPQLRSLMSGTGRSRSGRRNGHERE